MEIITAPAPGQNVVEWTQSNRDRLAERLGESGLVLLRGFESGAGTTLRDMLGVFGLAPMADARWSTPRSAVGEGAFTSTEYPPEQWIVLHSEMSYARSWPRLLAFQCRVPAGTGGATTVCDLAALSAAIPDLVEEFHEREVLYLRNFRPGIDIPWQNAFGTEDPEEVARIAEANELEIEWMPDGTLRTAQQAQGAITSPAGALWFNQAQLFHPLQFDPETRAALERAFGVEGLPRNATFGDGEPIPDAAIRRVLDALETHTRPLDWQAGDVALLDNMRWMHGRAPFTGARKVHVAMGGPESEPDLTPLFH